MAYHFGWKEQPSDTRDFAFKLPSKAVTYPDKVDLSALLPNVLDQGELGSCTAHGIVAAIYAALKVGKKKPFIASRLFIYYEERFIENTIDCDCGAYIRDGFKVINKQGAPDELLWKYDIKQFREHPPMSVYDAAKLHKTVRYEAVRAKKDDFKACLFQSTPIVLGFKVYESFYKIDAKGIMPNPLKGEKLEGGHCVIAYGYDKDGVWCRNSWNDKWGKKGNFRMSWDFLQSGNVSDCWRILLNE